jgi:hypothetical protein
VELQKEALDIFLVKVEEGPMIYLDIALALAFVDMET